MSSKMLRQKKSAYMKSKITTMTDDEWHLRLVVSQQVRFPLLFIYFMYSKHVIHKIKVLYISQTKVVPAYPSMSSSIARRLIPIVLSLFPPSYQLPAI